MPTEALLECRKLAVHVPGRQLVNHLDLDVRNGEFVAVLGQNGVGKSLLLHTLAGLRQPADGEVVLGGTRLAGLTRQQVAMRLALLPQYTEDIFPATAFDTVMIGRHPHIGRFRWESEGDRQMARTALERVGLGTFSDRDVLTLSGGERRRVAVAQVLTQAPEIYLLDEPTNHLDPQHQLDVLRLFGRLRRAGNAVVATLHDVNLASRYADRCLLLYGDGRWDIGDTAAILSQERLSELYATSMEAIAWGNRQIFVPADDAGPQAAR